MSGSAGAQSRQPVGFGRNVGGLQVKVPAVLDGLALGHRVKDQERPEPAVGVRCDGANSSVAPSLTRRCMGWAQNCASWAASWALKLIATTEMLMMWCFGLWWC